jgi:hypothetical protein
MGAGPSCVENVEVIDVDFRWPETPQYFGHKVRFDSDDGPREFDLSEYPEAYIDYLCEREGSYSEVVERLQDWGEWPCDAPIRLLRDPITLFRGAEGITTETPTRWPIGFASEDAVELYADGTASWFSSHMDNDQHYRRLNWCLSASRGDWLLIIDKWDSHLEQHPLSVAFFHDADAAAFAEAFDGR